MWRNLAEAFMGLMLPLGITREFQHPRFQSVNPLSLRRHCLPRLSTTQEHVRALAAPITGEGVPFHEEEDRVDLDVLKTRREEKRQVDARAAPLFEDARRRS